MQILEAIEHSIYGKITALERPDHPTIAIQLPVRQVRKNFIKKRWLEKSSNLALKAKSGYIFSLERASIPSHFPTRLSLLFSIACR